MLSIYFSLLFILLSIFFLFFFFFKQKTAYEMRISDWSSDVCSSDLSAHDSRRAEHSFLCNTRLLVGYGFITVAASAGQDSAACDRHCAAGGGQASARIMASSAARAAASPGTTERTISPWSLGRPREAAIFSSSGCRPTPR